MDDTKLYAIDEPEAPAARNVIHLSSARRHAKRQVRLVGRSWPRAQRTLRELLREPRRAAPQPQLALQLRAYEPMDRRHYQQPFDGPDRRRK